MRAESLASLIGDEAAIRLIKAKAGKRVYITKSGQGTIGSIVGLDAGKILSEAFGGSYLRVPFAKAWRFDRAA